MKLHLRPLHGLLPIALFLVIILAAASPVSALDSSDARQGPDQPNFPPAIVRCDPSYAEGYTDGTVAVDLYLEDTQNTYGIDVQVSFDEAIAKVADQSGAPGTQIAPLYSWFVPGMIISNVACNPGDPSSSGCSAPEDVGTIWYAATQLNPTLPVNGSGPFARVTFQPLTFGTFTMNFFYHKLSDTNGIEVPSTAQDCTVKFMSPLAVDLASFAAEGGPGGVALRWETVSEVRHVGFNVLRADAADGPWRQVSSALIPASAPGSSTGSAYTWEDRDVEPGRTYYYTLEDVSIDGLTTRHEPLVVTLQGPNAVRLTEFTGRVEAGWVPALLASLALFFIAFRRIRG